MGGLRLIVNLSTGNSVMCRLAVGIGSQDAPLGCNDMDSVDRGIESARALERYIDALWGGPGEGWLRIVETPEEARAVINQGKLAMVLGIEISNLYDCFLTPSPRIASRTISSTSSSRTTRPTSGSTTARRFRQTGTDATLPTPSSPPPPTAPLPLQRPAMPGRTPLVRSPNSRVPRQKPPAGLRRRPRRSLALAPSTRAVPSVTRYPASYLLLAASYLPRSPNPATRCPTRHLIRLGGHLICRSSRLPTATSLGRRHDWRADLPGRRPARPVRGAPVRGPSSS